MKGLYVDDGREMIELLRLGVRFDECQRKFVYKPEWELAEKTKWTK